MGRGLIVHRQHRDAAGSEQLGQGLPLGAGAGGDDDVSNSERAVIVVGVDDSVGGRLATSGRPRALGLGASAALASGSVRVRWRPTTSEWRGKTLASADDSECADVDSDSDARDVLRARHPWSVVLPLEAEGAHVETAQQAARVRCHAELYWPGWLNTTEPGPMVLAPRRTAMSATDVISSGDSWKLLRSFTSAGSPATSPTPGERAHVTRSHSRRSFDLSAASLTGSSRALSAV